VLAEQPPPTNSILSVYELKLRTELVQCYNVTARFPTQPTWTAATKNIHYKSWPGLTAKVTARHFPDSNETLRGHGRKIQANLRSTKKAIQEEAAAKNEVDAYHIQANLRPEGRQWMKKLRLY
jgi:hypothetical protein